MVFRINEQAWRGANEGGHQPRLNVRQVLDTDDLPARFFAVFLNPNTGKRLVTVAIADLPADSQVELAIERQTFFPIDDGAE